LRADLLVVLGVEMVEQKVCLVVLLDGVQVGKAFGYLGVVLGRHSMPLFEFEMELWVLQLIPAF
jgi:hypothetical protein